MRSVNPATGEPIRDYPEHDPAAVERLLAQGRGAASTWRGTPPHDRAPSLRRAALVLRARQAECAPLMTAEMGKPIAAAEAAGEKGAGAREDFAEHPPGFIAPESVATQ